MLTLPTHRPLIVARRGARAHAPENTLVAFELAVEQGADAIEMDVQFTADGELIIMQGLTVDHVSDGTGRIRSHTLEEIRALDVGGWFSPDFAGLRLPTLSEALDALAGRVQVVLELKTYASKSEGMEEMVWEQLKARDLLDQAVVTSFNPYALRRLKKLAPDLRTGFMQATGMPRWYAGNLARRFSRADDWHPEFEFVNPATVREVKQPLWLWPVTDPDRLALALAWDAAALITDDPAWLRQELKIKN